MSEFTGELVTVRFLRVYPYGGRDYVEGETLEVPDWSADSMVRARRAEYVTDEGTEDPADSVDATPSALALAAERGVDLSTHAGSGSGPNGRIYVEDVERWATA